MGITASFFDQSDEKAVLLSMKTMKGTWFEFKHHNIPEGKYWNPICRKFTDEQWRAKVKEMHHMGMEYVVLMCSSLVYEDEEYIAYMQDWHPDAMEILYPESVGISVKTSYYKNLPESSLERLNSLWETLKIDTGTETWVYVTSLVIVVTLASFLIYRAIVKKIRSRMY